MCRSQVYPYYLCMIHARRSYCNITHFSAVTLAKLLTYHLWFICLLHLYIKISLTCLLLENIYTTVMGTYKYTSDGHISALNYSYFEFNWAVVHPAASRTKAAHWISLSLKCNKNTMPNSKPWILVMYRFQLNNISQSLRLKWLNIKNKD